MKLIPLSQGKFAQVDDKDFEELSKYKWHAFKVTANLFYARRNQKINGKQRQSGILMHRQILNICNRMFVDHINGNGLDNTRNNIRLCNATQNNRNARAYKTASSKYKGVSKSKNRKKYKGTITFRGKCIHLGYFIEEINAAIAYNIAAVKYFGEFACLNIITP